MYVQKDTYTYIHHTDMSVLNTYMSVFNTDMSECACICLNVYVFYFLWDSIVFLLSLYVVCFFAIDTSTYIHVWICMYDVCIVPVFCLNSASILSYIQAHTYMYVCACILNEFSARFVPIHTDTCIQWRQATGKQQCFLLEDIQHDVQSSSAGAAAGPGAASPKNCSIISSSNSSSSAAASCWTGKRRRKSFQELKKASALSFASFAI